MNGKRNRFAGAIMAAMLLVLAMSAAGEAAAADTRVFELRIYTTHEGKLDDLLTRFRDHTNPLFVKHGMSLIGYWTPSEGEEAGKTLIYILAYPSREARDASWKAFRNDPVWTKAYEESHKDGPLVEKVDSKFLTPTDFSPIQ